MTQPDAKHFLPLTPSKEEDLLKRMGRIFDKIFAAAIKYERKVIVMAGFGCGAFSVLYRKDLFVNAWMPAFRKSFSAWSTKLHEAQVEEISMMGGHDDPTLKATIKNANFTSKVYTYFPEPICGDLGARLGDTMFINAWDPWSIMGNGNFADHSLDGYIGRATAIAALGWPKTNPYLLLE